MRGAKKTQRSMLSLRTPEQRVPKGHPLLAIKTMADEALATLSPKFDEMYAPPRGCVMLVSDLTLDMPEPPQSTRITAPGRRSRPVARGEVLDLTSP